MYEPVFWARSLCIFLAVGVDFLRNPWILHLEVWRKYRHHLCLINYADQHNVFWAENLSMEMHRKVILDTKLVLN